MYWIFLIATSFSLLLAPMGIAQSEAADSPIKVNLVANKVVQADGKEKLESADAAKPGEIIRYTATYTNSSDKAVKQLEETIPVPTGTEVILASVKPSGAKASTDKEHFSAIPLKRKEVQPDGKTREALVPTYEYRAIRWSVADLDAGKSSTATVDVRMLISSPKPAEKGKAEAGK